LLICRIDTLIVHTNNIQYVLHIAVVCNIASTLMHGIAWNLLKTGTFILLARCYPWNQWLKAHKEDGNCMHLIVLMLHSIKTNLMTCLHVYRLLGMQLT